MPPPDAPEVFVIGKQWMWKIQHPDGQREINELHIPVGRPVKLTLTSEDVIHDFFVPAFRTKIDVIPGRYVHTWFHPTKTGRFHLFCSQYCGTSHANMVGTVVVMEREEYRTGWAASGRRARWPCKAGKLFLKFQCITCHSANAAGPRAGAGRICTAAPCQPAKRPHRRGRRRYLRESILYPEAKVVQGWEPIMPTFKGQVDEEELIQLLAFIKSLKPGQTPVRTEEARRRWTHRNCRPEAIPSRRKPSRPRNKTISPQRTQRKEKNESKMKQRHFDSRVCSFLCVLCVLCGEI